MFARHGYVFLYLFRRGVGLSADQGANAVDLMTSEFAAHGQEARNKLQLRLLDDREMSDALSGLAFLRALPGVDARDVAVVGHSLGGSLTLLLAEREPSLRAVVVFSGAGYSWDRSPALRARLLGAVAHIRAPVFLIHAANDFSLGAGKALDARLTELGKPHLSKIYPPIGRTADDGHAFLYLGVSRWEPDVFAFLDEHMRRVSPPNPPPPRVVPACCRAGDAAADRDRAAREDPGSVTRGGQGEPFLPPAGRGGRPSPGCTDTIGRSTRIGWATMAPRISSSVAEAPVRPKSSAGVPRTLRMSRGESAMSLSKSVS